MPEKILIADDEEEITELLREAMERSGFEVSTVSHGSSLLHAIKAGKPDLLIMDVLMPGIDGYSLQIQLAQDEATKDIPVVVITALPASKPLFDKFEQVKMFLAKPFNIDDLVDKVREIFKSRK